MRKVCYRFADYLPYDYAGMERRAEKLAAKGWYLEKMGVVFWKLRRGEPKQVRYSVTYLSELSEFNPGPTEEQLTLEEFCREAGWERVTEWHQLQIYRSAWPDPVPLETEERVRLEVICEAMKKSYLPGMLFFIAWFAYLVFKAVRGFLNQPVARVTDIGSLCGGLIIALGAVIEVALLADYALWYWRSKRSIRRGGGCVSARSGRYLSRAGLAIILALFLVWLVPLFLESRAAFLTAVLYMAGIFGFGWVLRKLNQKRRQRGASRSANIKWFIAADIVIAILFVGVLFWCAANLFPALDGEDTVTYIAPEEMPLTLGDLMDAGDETDSCQRYDSATPLASRMVGWQELPDSEGELYLCYEVLETESPYLYELCKQEYLWTLEGWQEASIPPWGADEAYCRHFDSSAYYHWVVCRDTQILDLYVTWPLTKEQMMVIAEKLLN